MIDLWLGDCLELMPQIPDGSVDMVLADLPYGTTACKWDTIIPLEPLWAQYRRVIKRNGAIVLTASQPFTTTLINSNPKWFRYAWVWEKDKAANILNARRQPMKVHEDVLVFADEVPIYNPQMEPCAPYRHKHRSVQSANFGKNTSGYDTNGYTEYTERFPRTILRFSKFAGGRGADHPTQKPVALMEYLIRTYTNEGETVLDNTCGSGTTLVAAINTGRHAIGIEKDEDYYRVACQRVEAAQHSARQLTLELTA